MPPATPVLTLSRKESMLRKRESGILGLAPSSLPPSDPLRSVDEWLDGSALPRSSIPEATYAGKSRMRTATRFTPPAPTILTPELGLQPSRITTAISALGPRREGRQHRTATAPPNREGAASSGHRRTVPSASRCIRCPGQANITRPEVFNPDWE